MRPLYETSHGPIAYPLQAMLGRRSFLLGAAGAVGLRAQSAIAVDVRLVQVTFSVRDASGAIVPGLTAEDFEVFEDDAPQRLTRFSHGGDAPLRLGVLVDGSGSQQAFFDRHRHDLADFLDAALEPRDGAFLLGFGNSLRLICDFANDSDAMMARLDYYRSHPGRLPTVGPEERREGGTAVYDAIYHSIHQKLSGDDGGRRALLALTDGGDNSSAYHMLDALEAAQAADVRLFSIWYAESSGGRRKARDRYGLRALGRLAQDTGGELFEGSDESLREQFRRISEDLRTSYEAAYYSSKASNDGRFRQVEIRPRDATLRVRSRPGYYAR